MEPIQEAQKDTQPRDADEDPLTEKSHDIQPFENDRDGVKERHCKYETQPRKTDDVQAPVAIQDTEEQPKRKDDVQPLDVNASMEAQDGVQLSKVLQDEEPQVTIQCPDGKQEIQKMEGNRPEMAWDIQPSGIAPENLLDDMREPRKRVATLDDEQEEPSLVEDDIPRNFYPHREELESTIPYQDGMQETLETTRKTTGLAESVQPSRSVTRERSLIGKKQRQNPPDVTCEREPRRCDEEVQPDFVQTGQPRKRNSKYEV
ncbi:hypothetical protein OG21DRAFT_154306 [Imleria badia]|nr:hypothetical protein OG21DRAFT_154306 [Imleria badia]